ncbi:MAG: protein-tyrosine-phosphatase [Myxococcota bacterium]
MYPALQRHIEQWVGGFDTIDSGRRAVLEHLAAFVTDNAGGTIPLTFICTHNSRRSHMAQLWAAAAAAHYGVSGVAVFSGGTETTAFNPRAVAAMERAGFVIETPGGENPRYLVSYADGAEPIACFSKVYDDPVNPSEGFAAVMTCSSADEACPVVQGAAERVSITYEDPKASDDTPEETDTYDARCRQIATEMLFVFSRVK